MAKQERKTVAKRGDVRCSEGRQEFSSKQQKKKKCEDTSGSSIVEEKTLRRSEDGGEITFIVIQKNVTSLCSSDRVAELAREKDHRWKLEGQRSKNRKLKDW